MVSMIIILLIVIGAFMGMVYLLEKKISFDKYHPATILIAISLIGSIFAVPLLFYKFQIPTEPKYWIVGIASMLVYGIGSLFEFKAYKSVDASTLSLVGKLNIVIAAIIGILLFKDTYMIGGYIGLILIIVGSIVVLYEKKTFHMSKGISFVIFMAIGFAISTILDKIVLNGFSPFTYVFINNFGIGILFLLIYPQARKELWSLIKSYYKLIIPCALLTIVSWAGFLYVLQNYQISYAYTLYEGTSLVAVVVFGIIFLRERSKLWQKLLGLLVLLAGIILLNGIH